MRTLFCASLVLLFATTATAQFGKNTPGAKPAAADPPKAADPVAAPAGRSRGRRAGCRSEPTFRRARCRWRRCHLEGRGKEGDRAAEKTRHG